MNTRSRCRPGCWPQLTRSPKPTQPSLKGGSAEGISRRTETTAQIVAIPPQPAWSGWSVSNPHSASRHNMNALWTLRASAAPNWARTKRFNSELPNDRTEIVSFVHSHHEAPSHSGIGRHSPGMRRVFIFTVSGGQFVGDRFRGGVLPRAGSDLLLVRQDGSCQQDVRPILRIEDGALILMTYRGVRHASEDVNARMTRGERVSPSDYYLRTVPFFETSSPKYAWLNKIVSVAVGERQLDGVSYEVFEIL
jgi:hypothetical protein